MKRTMVMGDIHGAYKALLQCLERSHFNYENDQLIQLGDIVDGFPEVYECVEELLKIRHLVPIKGNHDDWFREFAETDFHPYYWTYGGKGTLISYLNNAGKSGRYFASGSGYKSSLNTSDIPEAHKAFFERQQLFHIDPKNRCFVHGGFNRHLSFEAQETSAYYWDRSLWEEAITHFRMNGNAGETFFNASNFEEIFIGHTTTTKLASTVPLRIANIINVDTGAGHSGRLTIMDVDTKAYWQSDPSSDLYPENFR